jgi:hypothetical protein
MPSPVQPVGLSPSILAVRLFGPVESVAGILRGLVGVAGGEERFGGARRRSTEYFPKPQVSASRMAAWPSRWIEGNRRGDTGVRRRQENNRVGVRFVQSGWRRLGRLAGVVPISQHRAVLVAG